MKALHTTDTTRSNRGASMGPTALTLMALFALAPLASAQIPTGTILGGVKDSTGGTVPGATVTATNVGTQYSRSVTTDATGQYALRLLPVGNYALTVSMPGFKNYSQTGILLEVGRNARIDPVIELGALTEVVSIVADAPLVETTSASLSRTVGQNEVLNLPLVNRDLYSLLSLTGGVMIVANAASFSAQQLAFIAVNGKGKVIFK